MAEETAPMNDVDDYIARFPEDVRALLEQVRQTIKESAPQAQERISYQMPTYFLEGNLVHFAGYEKHIGFYPTPSGITHFKEQLAGYKSAKGSVQFPLDKPIPLALIAEMTRFRVEENLAKAAAKRAGR